MRRANGQWKVHRGPAKERGPAHILKGGRERGSSGRLEVGLCVCARPGHPLWLSSVCRCGRTRSTVMRYRWGSGPQHGFSASHSTRRRGRSFRYKSSARLQMRFLLRYSSLSCRHRLMGSRVDTLLTLRRERRELSATTRTLRHRGLSLPRWHSSKPCHSFTDQTGSASAGAAVSTRKAAQGPKGGPGRRRERPELAKDKQGGQPFDQEGKSRGLHTSWGLRPQHSVSSRTFSAAKPGQCAFLIV